MIMPKNNCACISWGFLEPTPEHQVTQVGHPVLPGGGAGYKVQYGFTRKGIRVNLLW